MLLFYSIEKLRLCWLNAFNTTPFFTLVEVCAPDFQSPAKLAGSEKSLFLDFFFSPTQNIHEASKAHQESKQ